jgi:hypothetical protein
VALTIGAVVVDIRFRHYLNPSDKPYRIFQARIVRMLPFRNPRSAILFQNPTQCSLGYNAV